MAKSEKVTYRERCVFANGNEDLHPGVTPNTTVKPFGHHRSKEEAGPEDPLDKSR